MLVKRHRQGEASLFRAHMDRAQKQARAGEHLRQPQKAHLPAHFSFDHTLHRSVLILSMVNPGIIRALVWLVLGVNTRALVGRRSRTYGLLMHGAEGTAGRRPCAPPATCLLLSAELGRLSRGPVFHDTMLHDSTQERAGERASDTPYSVVNTCVARCNRTAWKTVCDHPAVFVAKCRLRRRIPSLEGSSPITAVVLSVSWSS